MKCGLHVFLSVYVHMYPVSEGIRLAMSVQEMEGSNSVSTSNQRFAIHASQCCLSL